MRKALLALAVLIALAVAPNAFAAGETTHAWMAERAVDQLPAGDLKSLLDAHRLELMSGAGYPDTGYWIDGYVPDSWSDDFGEWSHWELFINDYVTHIRDKGCGDLGDPLGPCAGLVAHLMGAAAHGMGDEVWDWLFEPRVTDHGEDPAKNFFAEPNPGAPLDGNPLDDLSSSIEYAMDEVAISEHGRVVPPPTIPPPVSDLVDVYAAHGRHTTAEHILAGHGVSAGAMAAERAAAPEEGPRVVKDMPWSAANFVTAPGGVEFSAGAIAGYYEALWRKLTEDEHPAPQVVSIYPSNGAAGVPFDWQPAKTSPGPATGGGELRIWAAFSNAVEPGTVAASFRLLDPKGRPVAAMDGFPKAGPWGSDWGTHSVLFYPRYDLAPCTHYTAVITTGLRDLAGAALPAEKRWSFTTAADPAVRCRKK